MNMQQSQPEEQNKNTAMLPALPEAAEYVEERLHNSAVQSSKTEEVEELGAILSRMVSEHLSRSGRLMWSSVLIYFLMALIPILALKFFAETPLAHFVTSPRFLLPFIAAGIIPAALLIHNSISPRKKRRKIVEDIVRMDDIRSIGPLIDALKLVDLKISFAVIEILIRLFPRLLPSDTHLISAKQRAYLCQILSLPPNIITNDAQIPGQTSHNDTTLFRIAILQALSQVGDKNCLQVVRKLALGPARSESQKRIQVAAQNCLPLLLSRVEQQQSSQTLLRAADPINCGTETLLRPASNTSLTAPEQLLRPSSLH